MDNIKIALSKCPDLPQLDKFNGLDNYRPEKLWNKAYVSNEKSTAHSLLNR